MPDLATAPENWNTDLFLRLHATVQSPHWMIATAVWLAEVPLLLALALTAWQLCRHRDLDGAIRVTIACAIAVLIEAAVSELDFHPRPFAAGFGPAWAMHTANNSMPSTHVTLAWIMALIFGLGHRIWTSLALFMLGVTLAWARIYVGIHWPADMLGAAISACASVAAAYGLSYQAHRLLKRLRS